MQVLDGHEELLVVQQRLQQGLHAPPPIVALVGGVIDGLLRRGPGVVPRQQRQPVLHASQSVIPAVSLTDREIQNFRV